MTHTFKINLLLGVGLALLYGVIRFVRWINRPTDTVEFQLNMFRQVALRQPDEDVLDRLRDLWHKRHWEFTAEQETRWRDLCYFVERAIHHKNK